MKKKEQEAGKFNQVKKRILPGLNPKDDLEVLYFSDNGTEVFRKQFFELSDKFKPPYPTGGGVTSEACRIRLPYGLLFHGVSYHTDIEGWRRQIEAGAQELGAVVGKIQGDRFVVSDGRSVALADCEIQVD